jgi:hypothetical protein
MADVPQEPDYRVAWKAILAVLVIVLISAYIDHHPALKARLAQGK